MAKRIRRNPSGNISSDPHCIQLETRELFRRVTHELMKGRPRRALNVLQGGWFKVENGDHIAGRELERTLKTIMELKNSQEDDAFELEKLTANQ